jgi:hypothetical protein
VPDEQVHFSKLVGYEPLITQWLAKESVYVNTGHDAKRLVVSTDETLTAFL